MTEDQAKQRFMLLNLARLSGIILVLIGIANLREKLLPEYSPTLGAILLVAGAIDFFLAPVLMKKAWRERP